MKRIHQRNIHCKSVYRHICDKLDADLNSPQCKEIKAHIETCKNCTTYLDSLKKMILLYRKYPVPTIPAKTHKRLFAAISVESVKTE